MLHVVLHALVSVLGVLLAPLPVLLFVDVAARRPIAALTRGRSLLLVRMYLAIALREGALLGLLAWRLWTAGLPALVGLILCLGAGVGGLRQRLGAGHTAQPLPRRRPPPHI